jgi:opacity protein-like surface antigen
MRKNSLAPIFVLTCVAMASAQSPLPKGNVFFGYSHANTDIVSGPSTGLNGWDGQLEGSVFPFISVVVDVGGYYGSTSLVNLGCIPGGGFSCNANGSVYTALLGPRASFSVGKFRPFAHALFGVGHVSTSTTGFSDSDTSFGDAIGGGLDYKLFPALAWRVQGDYLQTRFYGGTQNNARFSTGIVLRF